MSSDLRSDIEQTHQRLSAALVSEMGEVGHWTGYLSSSALSTATAVTALSAIGRDDDLALVRRGLAWLAAHANADGGWGDSIRSQSNLSTTALVWAAFGAAKANDQYRAVMARTLSYISQTAGSIEQLVPALEARYGRDRTFSVPITMTLALSGRLGPDGWQRVRPLPFELAAVPRRFYSALRLPVVSYALPALIAIGQVIHHHAPRFRPFRSWTRSRTLEVLTTLQPPNGGFLEATPLTSFVTMSLAAMGQEQHVVAKRGANFLRQSVRSDGSWPIDTNLATWVTTLAVKALSHKSSTLSPAPRAAIREWLLGQQWRREHPYTGAAPGGWAWTDLPGGVPDADDTAGALLALVHLRPSPREMDEQVKAAVSRGVNWLLGLQNRDGGIPTFCRGWGARPFDRSTPELTVHALRAWAAWLPLLQQRQALQVHRAARRALQFLARSQRKDGAWVPLWFGNEDAPEHENPTYGTAQVLIGLGDIRASALAIDSESERAARTWLKSAQGLHGGWGGAPEVEPTLEETALATSALVGVGETEVAVSRGVRWLLNEFSGGEPQASPIGLYFARLWYSERLYPTIFAVDALGRVLR